MSIKIESSRNITRVSYRPQIRLQIDQMSIEIESSRNITNASAIDCKVRLQMATSVCVSDFKLIKCRLKLKAQEYYKRVSYRPRSPTSNNNECLCVRLQIDQMSIKIESSRNITNASAVYTPKSDFMQMATSVCVSDLIQIDQMSIKIESSRNITNESAIDPKIRLQMATIVCVYITYSFSAQLILVIKST